MRLRVADSPHIRGYRTAVIGDRLTEYDDAFSEASCSCSKGKEKVLLVPDFGVGGLS
jgi:hypothetical protein